MEYTIEGFTTKLPEDIQQCFVTRFSKRGLMPGGRISADTGWDQAQTIVDEINKSFAPLLEDGLSLPKTEQQHKLVLLKKSGKDMSQFDNIFSGQYNLLII